MRRNSLLITENERRQIMSLYGLISEGKITNAKYNGTIVLPPNEYEKFQATVTFKKGDEVILTVKTKSDYTFEIETQVESEVSYEISISGSYRIKGSKKDIGFSGEKSFTVEVTEKDGVVQPINQSVKIVATKELEREEVPVSRGQTNLDVYVYDLRFSQPLKNIDVEIVRKKTDGEELSRTTSKTDDNGKLKIQERTQKNVKSNVDEFFSLNTSTLKIEIIINIEGYKSKTVEMELDAGVDSNLNIGLVSIKEFKQEIDTFKSGLYVPKYYKSNFFTIYGHTGTAVENDKEMALKLGRLDPYLQFLKKVKKKYRENEIVKNAIPTGGEIVFKFPQNQNMYYYIVKYKRSELKKFVKSLLKVEDDVEEDDDDIKIEDKSNKLSFENISLESALSKAKTQGKNIFILVGNDGEGLDKVLKVIDKDKEFVKNTNNTKVRIRIEVDDESYDYGLLRDIIRDNHLSMTSHPRIIYMNKDKKILENYDFDTITTDGIYKL